MSLCPKKNRMSNLQKIQDTYRVEMLSATHSGLTLAELGKILDMHDVVPHKVCRFQSSRQLHVKHCNSPDYYNG